MGKVQSDTEAEYPSAGNSNFRSRRDILKQGAMWGVAGGLVHTAGSRRAAAQPRSGGHAVFGISQGATSDSLALTNDGNPHVQTLKEGMLRNKLIDLDSGGNLEPDLAVEWEASPDVRTWTFTLRQGVEFHNGKTLTQQDVIESINVHRGEDSKSPGKSLLKAVSRIYADGSDKVVFELSEGNADLPRYLAMYIFEICPVIDGAVDDISGVGTGPFRLDNYEPGVRASGTRNPNYFKNGLPYLDSVELLSIRDPQARINALISGQVDAVDAIDYKLIDRVANSDGVSVVDTPSGSTITMPMRVDMNPFDQQDIRLAVKYGLDRADLRDRIFKAHATLGNDHPISVTSPYYNPDIPQREFDPDRARHHLRRAGLETVDLSLHASEAAFSGCVDAAALFAESGRKAGLNISVVREPTDGYWTNVWNQVGFCYCYWNAYPTPDLIFSLAYAGDAAWGDTRWKNERFDDLLLKARVEPDDVRRREMYYEMQQILHDDGATAVPLFQNFIHGISDSIGHGLLASSSAWDGFRAPELWWRNA